MAKLDAISAFDSSQIASSDGAARNGYRAVNRAVAAGARFADIDSTDLAHPDCTSDSVPSRLSSIHGSIHGSFGTFTSPIHGAIHGTIHSASSMLSALSELGSTTPRTV